MTNDSERTPRWVKVAGAVALVVIVLLLVLLLVGRGGHGPRRHILGADTTIGYTGPPPAVTHP